MATLRDLPRDEFRKMMEGLAGSATAGPIPPFQPSNQSPPSPSGSIRQQIPSNLLEPYGARQGIPLDMVTGARAGIRAKLGFDSNEFNQTKILAGEYGLENVDKNPQGGWVIRNQPDGTGSVHDLLVNPPGLDKGDIASMTADIIPMVAGAVGAVATRGKIKNPGAISKWLQNLGPIAKVEAGAVGMAAGTELSGAAQDMAFRLQEGFDVDTPEIAKERLKAAVVDLAFANAFAGGAKVASKTLSALSGVVQIPVGETASTQAAKSLQEATRVMERKAGVVNPKGVQYPLTPGQAAESRFLLRLESIGSRRLGSAGAFDKIIAQQQVSEDELRRIFYGLPRTLSDDELAAAMPKADVVGEGALIRLRREVDELTGTVEQARANLQKTGTAEAQDLAQVNLENKYDVRKVGGIARRSATGAWDRFKADSAKAYNAFLSKPEIRTRNVSGNFVANMAESVEASSTPSAVNRQGTQRLDAFVAPKVRNFIDTLKGLQGSMVSVNDLKLVRTQIDDAIAEGVSIPGTDISQLMQLREGLSNGIETALKGMQDPTLLGQWKQLTENYKTGIQRFNRSSIRPLLVKEGEQGSLGNAEIAESVMGGSAKTLDRYMEFKAFFGANSSEFKILQKTAREQILGRTLGDTTRYVEGAKLRSALLNTRAEVAQELFGANQSELAKIGEILQKTEGRLDVDELYRLMQQKSLTAARVNDLLTAEGNRARAFNNKLIRAAARGEIDAESIKPTEFVRYALDMAPKDAQRVMGVLSDRPALVEDIRQLALEDLFNKAQVGVPGKERIASLKLREALGSETQHRTWEALIGKEGLDGVKKLANTVASREISEQEFAGGGALAGAMDVSQLAFHPELSVIKGLATRYLLGFLYSRPLKRMVTNLFTGQDQSRFLNAIIGSTPFIESLQERFKEQPDTAVKVMEELGNMVGGAMDRSMKLQGQVPGGEQVDPRSLSREEFKQYMENIVKE